jgi:hypothetical protein
MQQRSLVQPCEFLALLFQSSINFAKHTCFHDQPRSDLKPLTFRLGTMIACPLSPWCTRPWRFSFDTSSWRTSCRGGCEKESVTRLERRSPIPKDNLKENRIGCVIFKAKSSCMALIWRSDTEMNGDLGRRLGRWQESNKWQTERLTWMGSIRGGEETCCRMDP